MKYNLTLTLLPKVYTVCSLVLAPNQPPIDTYRFFFIPLNSSGFDISMAVCGEISLSADHIRGNIHADGIEYWSIGCMCLCERLCVYVCVRVFTSFETRWYKNEIERRPKRKRKKKSKKEPTQPNLSEITFQHKLFNAMLHLLRMCVCTRSTIHLLVLFKLVFRSGSFTCSLFIWRSFFSHLTLIHTIYRRFYFVKRCIRVVRVTYVSWK